MFSFGSSSFSSVWPLIALGRHKSRLPCIFIITSTWEKWLLSCWWRQMSGMMSEQIKTKLIVSWLNTRQKCEGWIFSIDCVGMAREIMPCAVLPSCVFRFLSFLVGGVGVGQGIRRSGIHSSNPSYIHSFMFTCSTNHKGWRLGVFGLAIAWHVLRSLSRGTGRNHCQATLKRM